MSTQITTGKVRFSYCNLFTPRAVQEGATPKYSVTLLIPKSDKATMQKIKAAMDEAKQKFMASNSGKKLPTNLKSTLHDGDGEPLGGGVVTDSDWDDGWEDEDDNDDLLG